MRDHWAWERLPLFQISITFFENWDYAQFPLIHYRYSGALGTTPILRG